MHTFLEFTLEVVCAALGMGVLFLLFGKRIRFVEEHRLPWWGVRKTPNGRIEMHAELLPVLGLLIVFVGFGLWALWKTI
jgi:hypothetical protein